MQFHPNNTNAMISYGRSHIAFWTITDDMKVVKKMGIFEVLGVVHNLCRHILLNFLHHVINSLSFSHSSTKHFFCKSTSNYC